jgi:hypothetical protein
MIPGQFGPMRRVFLSRRKFQTRTMSSAGTPSVMQTTRATSAAAASMIASAPNGGGTKMTLALAPVSFTASATVLNTGISSTFCPPLPGVTPATTRVP